MARMAIDDSFLRDPRVERLGRRCGWSKRETRGALLDVFALCYDRVSSVLDPADIDFAAEMEGFSALMVEVGLASPVRNGVRISGSEDRIRYLQSRSETGRQGGVKSGEARRANHRRSPSKDPKVTFEENEGLLNPPDLVPDPSPPPVPSPVPDQERKRVSTRPRQRDSLASVDAAAAAAVLSRLSAVTGVEYRGAKEHVKLVVARYRDGLDELDLRKVIAYVSRPTGDGALGWSDDSKMQKYLRPETLFGPQTIERYLDAARSWFAQRIGGDPQPSAEFAVWRDSQDPQPRLAVVK